MAKRCSKVVAFLVASSIASGSGWMVPMAYAQTAAPSTTSADAGASQGKVFTQQELDELLAPIALHPDALLAQILMASTYPLDVVEAARWRKSNPKVEGKELETAMDAQKWDPSVKSLTAFPNVLTMMNEKLDWTQRLGDAFLGQQKQVMDTVQGLRAKAKQAGSLQSSKEQTVSTTSEGGQTIIKVEAADPQVVYVPTYDPTVVYGPWWYPAPPPYYWYPPGYVPGAAFFSFTIGVAVGSWLWGGCNWGRGDINIDVNNFNRVNHHNQISGGDRTWNHNVENRRGVPYNSEGARKQYGERSGQARNTQAREEFRGRAESGRQDLGQNFDRGGAQAGQLDRNRDTGRAGVQDRAGDRGGVQDRAGGGIDRSPQAGTADRGSAFSGLDSGSRTRDFSSRGSTSRSMSGGGAAGGRSFSGGGARGGRR